MSEHMNKYLKALLLGLALLMSGKTIAQQPGQVVVLTFDDACISHYTYVAPLLKKYRFGATFYICEFPGWPDSTKYMNWQQIKALSNMGFEIGNHTSHHTNVDQLNDKQLQEEIA